MVQNKKLSSGALACLQIDWEVTAVGRAATLERLKTCICQELIRRRWPCLAISQPLCSPNFQWVRKSLARWRLSVLAFVCVDCKCYASPTPPSPCTMPLPWNCRVFFTGWRPCHCQIYNSWVCVESVIPILSLHDFINVTLSTRLILWSGVQINAMKASSYSHSYRQQ